MVRLEKCSRRALRVTFLFYFGLAGRAWRSKLDGKGEICLRICWLSLQRLLWTAPQGYLPPLMALFTSRQALSNKRNREHICWRRQQPASASWRINWAGNGISFAACIHVHCSLHPLAKHWELGVDGYFHMVYWCRLIGECCAACGDGYPGNLSS